MRSQAEGRVIDNTKISNMGGWVNSGTTDRNSQVRGRSRFKDKDNRLRFWHVKAEMRMRHFSSSVHGQLGIQVWRSEEREIEIWSHQQIEGYLTPPPHPAPACINSLLCVRLCEALGAPIQKTGSSCFLGAYILMGETASIEEWWPEKGILVW